MDQQETTSTEGSSSKRGLIITLVVLIVIIAAAAIGYSVLGTSANNAISEDELEPAQSFRMTTVGNAEVTLDELKGKPIVLNFWASNCGPCKREMPELQSAYERYGNDVNFVMVDIIGFNGETRTHALSFIEDSGYTFPVYFDSLRDATNAYGINSVPRTYFITAKGNVTMYVSGSMDKTTLEQGLELIL